MKMILQVTATTAVVDGVLVKNTLCVDQDGRAWELRRDRWEKLPALPLCSCPDGEPQTAAEINACQYHGGAR